MKKRYRKMKKKASRKVREVREGKVVIELPLPIAEVIGGMSEVVEALSREAGVMLMLAVMESECKRIARKKNSWNPERIAYWWGAQAGP